MIAAGAADAGECADAEPPRVPAVELAIRGFAPVVRIPQPRAIRLLASAAAVRASQIPRLYHLSALPTAEPSYTAPAVLRAGDSDLRAFGARFQQLVEADLDQPSAQQLIELAGRLQPETVGFAVNPIDRPVEIQVKSQASKRRRRVRGYHRRPGPTARIYSRLGLMVQLSHSPQSLTAAAAFLAGRKREAEHYEWRSHLSDLTGQGLSSRDQTRAALGFLWAALRLRLRDAAKLACGPVDALLRSRTLSNLLVLIPTWMAALYILRHLGTLGVVTSAESISAIGGGLYGLIRGGRWWRNVKPPEPKARRVKE